MREIIFLTSLTPGFAADVLVTGRGDFVAMELPSDRFSVFSIGEAADFSTDEIERRVEVTGLVGDFAVNDEVPLSFGFGVVARLVGFAVTLWSYVYEKRVKVRSR